MIIFTEKHPTMRKNDGPPSPGPVAVPGGKAIGRPRKVSMARTLVRSESHLVDGLLILGVSPEQLLEVAAIEHLFRAIGGSRKVLEYLAGSEEPEARKVIELRYRLTVAQAAAVPFEAYCIAAGVTTKRMFGIVSQEVMVQSQAATALLAESSHPEVVKASVMYAMEFDGHQDRRMLHQHMGFLPIPRTSVVNGNVTIDNRGGGAAVLPPMEDSVRGMSERFNAIASAAAPIETKALEGGYGEESGEEE